MSNGPVSKTVGRIRTLEPLRYLTTPVRSVRPASRRRRLPDIQDRLAADASRADGVDGFMDVLEAAAPANFGTQATGSDMVHEFGEVLADGRLDQERRDRSRRAYGCVG